MGEAKRRKAAGNYPDATKKQKLDTVSWQVVGDLSAHPKSAAVVSLLENLKKEYANSGGSAMLVTLESKPQEPIIKARVVGLDTFMALINAMEDLGLTDRLFSATGPEDGIDAAFS